MTVYQLLCPTSPLTMAQFMALMLRTVQPFRHWGMQYNNQASFSSKIPSPQLWARYQLTWVLLSITNQVKVATISLFSSSGYSELLLLPVLQWRGFCQQLTYTVDIYATVLLPLSNRLILRQQSEDIPSTLLQRRET